MLGAVAAGAILGFLAGLGVGGGSLLLLWLTIVVEMEPAAARGINLLFFLPAAVISIFFRRKQGAVPLRALLPGILGGCAAAAVFSWLRMGMDTQVLRKLFGILLLFTGIRELRYRPRSS